MEEKIRIKRRRAREIKWQIMKQGQSNEPLVTCAFRTGKEILRVWADDSTTMASAAAFLDKAKKNGERIWKV